MARLFRATLCSMRRRLGASESQALDAMLEHCFEAWGIRDPKQERERKRRYRIFERDGDGPPLAVYNGEDVQLRS